MAFSTTLKPTHQEKTLHAAKAERTITRATFHKTDANPGETLYIEVPRLNSNEVIVPGSLSLRLDI